MIAVEEALRLVLTQANPLPAARIPVGESLGCVLAENVLSDLDSPPWDKSMVDGYAIRVADLSTGTAELKVLEEVVAGAVPSQPIQPGTATRIMTGAPIPAGTEAVVMVERTELLANDRVRIEAPPHEVGQNILRCGSSFRRGTVIVPSGTTIGPVHVGLFCEVGRAKPLVIPRPRVAILSTGNELVSAAEIPQPGQIRNSNGPMLAALVAKVRATPQQLGVARDELDALRRLVAEGLKSDVLVLSGGVSAGVLDLVPQVLNELGVEQVFHKVSIKPGKPLWFGVRHREGRRTLVFGLPGNPVSSLVGFELFVRPAIERMAGRTAAPHQTYRAKIGDGRVHQRGNRMTYHPAVRESGAPHGSDLPTVKLLSWHGSADLRTLADANLLAILPPGDQIYSVGGEIEVLPI